MSVLSFQATCLQHSEDLLADELRACGAAEILERPGFVSFTGTLETAYRACLWSRIATRVLFPVATFPATTPEALRHGAATQQWDEQMAEGTTFEVSATVSRSAIHDSDKAARCVREGIVDFFRDRASDRSPGVTGCPVIRLYLHLFRDNATVSVTLSGEAPHGLASPSGTTAAAVLMRSGWLPIANTSGPFVDLMCGSGAFVIEAAQMALGVAPGLLRDGFGFEAWRNHDADLWRRLVADARAQRRATLPAPVVGYDANPVSVRNAQARAREAGIEDMVRFEVRDLSSCRPPEGRGLVVVSAPHGERVGNAEALVPLYRELGPVLRNHFPSWRVALLAGAPPLVSETGLQPDRVSKVYDGPVPCELSLFSVPPARTTHRVAARRRAHLAAEADSGSSGAAGPDNGTPMDANRSEAFDFSQRIKRNYRLMRRWAGAAGVSCYRLYDADLPQYAVAIDFYEGTWAHVQEYAPPAEINPDRAARRLADVVAVVPEVLGIEASNVFVKERRRQRGAQRYQKLAETATRHEVREAGFRFSVNFSDYLDTGLFLDHRLTRALIAQMAAERPFLNLFCYTATATVYAAGGGATRTVSVDTSRTYLEWARANLEQNGFGGGDHETVRQDAREFLRAEAQRGRGGYGLVFIDPPTFSNTADDREDFSVQAEHASLIRGALPLLAPAGAILFSTNYRKFKLDMEALDDLRISEITDQTIPHDFRRTPHIHRAWVIRS